MGNDRHDRFEEACGKAGLRMTCQRREIYRSLAASEDHPTAEMIHRRLARKMPMLALDTVYRTLASFTRHGLVQKVDTVESQARFDAKQEDHHHAICIRCHNIVDFQCPSIDQVKLPGKLSSWGKINRRNLVVYGVCRNCVQKEKSSRG